MAFQFFPSSIILAHGDLRRPRSLCLIMPAGGEGLALLQESRVPCILLGAEFGHPEADVRRGHIRVPAH